MGRALKLCVVAEGIETREQADALRDMGCDIGQGFLFAKALPPEEMEELALSGRYMTVECD
jgi:EAL domain-containing protein (putative c-di-GMP-specific phosphodiesterase class I)